MKQHEWMKYRLYVAKFQLDLLVWLVLTVFG